MTKHYVSDNYPEDPERFCGVCLAGLTSSEHREKCGEPGVDIWDGVLTPANKLKVSLGIPITVSITPEQLDIIDSDPIRKAFGLRVNRKDFDA